MMSLRGFNVQFRDDHHIRIKLGKNLHVRRRSGEGESPNATKVFLDF